MAQRLPPGPYRRLRLDDGNEIPYYIIPFDKRGLYDGPQTRRHLLDSAKEGSYSDIFLFSHGWINDWSVATRRYEEFITGYMNMRRKHNLPMAANYRPLLVGIFWPSTALVFGEDETGPQIAAADAHEFCQGFYPTVFSRLHKVLGGMQNGQAAEFEWVEALRPPRTGLCQMHQNDPENFRQWALPVIYVRPEIFRVSKAAAGNDPAAFKEMTGRAEMVASALRALPPGPPAEVRKQLLALLAGLRPELRPDPNGNFSAGG